MRKLITNYELIILFLIVFLSILLIGGFTITTRANPSVDPSLIVGQTIVTPTPAKQQFGLQQGDFSINVLTGSLEMKDYIQTYGFYPPTDIPTFSSDEIAKLSELIPFAIQGAAAYNKDYNEKVPAPLIVWWYAAEIYPHDFYTFSNCEDSTYALIHCGGTYSGGWQLGIGHQFSTVDELLPKAFTDLHAGESLADVGNAIMQKDKASQYVQPDELTQTFPTIYTINQITDGTSDMNWWASILSRDPKISAYINAEALRVSRFNKDLAFGWGSFYKTHWQDYSNTMAAVLQAWPQLTQGAQ